MPDVDLRVAQLLCSRLCHDLVGPAGAVSAGAEMLVEEPDAQDARDVLARSATEITCKLAFFRAAFGLGGGAATPVRLADVRRLASDYLSGGKVSLAWPGGEPSASGIPDAVPDAAAKLILLMVLLSSEALPRGGQVAVHFASLGEDGVGAAIAAEGEGAKLKDEVRAALDGAVADGDLDARNIHAHYARLVSGMLNGELEVSETPGLAVRFGVLFPADRLD